MLVYTWQEIEVTRLFEVENHAYNRIYMNIARRYGNRLAERMLSKMMEKTMLELLNASAMEFLEGFQII